MNLPHVPVVNLLTVPQFADAHLKLQKDFYLYCQGCMDGFLICGKQTVDFAEKELLHKPYMQENTQYNELQVHHVNAEISNIRCCKFWRTVQNSQHPLAEGCGWYVEEERTE